MKRTILITINLVIVIPLLASCSTPMLQNGESLPTIPGTTKATENTQSGEEIPIRLPATPVLTNTPEREPYLVFPPFGISGTRAWQVDGDRVTEITLPDIVMNQYDRSAASGKIILPSYFPDKGAGPANLAVGDLWIYDVLSQQNQLIFPDQNIVEAVWAPNGQDFAYLKATEMTYELRWRAIDGNDRLLAIDVAPTFSISPDGKLVAFTRETGYKVGIPGIYVVSVESGQERQIGVTDRGGAGSMSDFPLWSPDSRHLLLSIMGQGTPNGWLLIATDGSRELRLKYGPNVPEQFSQQDFAAYLWHPDSQHFLGTQVQGMMDPPYAQEVALANLNFETGEITQVTPLTYGPAYPLVWETPGERAWLMTDDGNLHLLDLAHPNPLPQACKVETDQIFVNPFKGYCMSYPLEFTIQAYEYERPLFLGPALDQSIEPVQARLWIEANPITTGSDLNTAVENFISSQPVGDPPITRQSMTISGEPAELLGNVPGQLFSRVVLVLHQDILYQLWFNPIEPSSPNVQPDVEKIFQAVTQSFSFLP